MVAIQDCSILMKLVFITFLYSLFLSMYQVYVSQMLIAGHVITQQLYQLWKVQSAYLHMMQQPSSEEWHMAIGQ
jgi:hypothetical protein